MDRLHFSFIIPVYNRPDEIQELLESMVQMDYKGDFEVVIIEDGSTKTSEKVVDDFSDGLQISYYKKENTGPGDSRNYGMKKASGNYFIVLDSDCILPPQYLDEVDRELGQDFVHCFGGADAAHHSFSNVQKAINYAMTSLWTTGGIRGRKKTLGKFQPRSFNMGISQELFKKTKGFGSIHPGEDPDLTFRIWKAGYRTRFFPKAFVYHKRRIDWGKFHTQVKKFGMVRAILNQWHPETAKLTYWFPTCFMVLLFTSMVLMILGWWYLSVLFGLYFLLVFMDSLFMNKSMIVALLSIVAVVVQFFGYGLGFLKSTILLNFNPKEPETVFPNLFFKKG